MDELLEIARRIGVGVVTSALPEGLLGCYLPDRRRIHLTVGLTPNEQRSVLAHELGHAHYGHPGTGALPASVVAGIERQADAYAARLLIDHAEYARLERVNPDPEFLADELDVTVDVIDVYRAQCLSRLAGSAYALPRMGAGQWGYREICDDV